MKGFHVGLVTNAYGALSAEDAALWLRPLAESGLSLLHVSNDTFHYGEEMENPAAIAYSTARRLDIEISAICIEPPKLLEQQSPAKGKGRPVVGGGAKFRGRTAEKLTKDLPLRPWQELHECPYEELECPSRVHVDAYGNVHICQGISMGNMWQGPLSEMVSEYRSDAHPICGPLVRGGPAELAKELGVVPETGYVDECHFCYVTRKKVREKLPDMLAAKQVYGME